MVVSPGLVLTIDRKESQFLGLTPTGFKMHITNGPYFSRALFRLLVLFHINCAGNWQAQIIGNLPAFTASFMHVGHAFIRLICHFTISHPRGELSPQYSRHRKHAFEFCRISALIAHWKIWCRLDEGTMQHLKKVRRGLEARLQTLCNLATLQPCNLEL